VRTLHRLKIAVYFRLSKEDEIPDESNSISNQRRLITAYISKYLGDVEQQVVEYIDDGFSGKNFQRPGFQQLIKAVREGKIGTILVKDISRLGRDYIEVGNYIESVFPFMGIRFISVNDDFDSNNYPEGGVEINTAFMNILNDYYSEDYSVRIKKTLASLQRSGAFLASFAPYGYEKDKSNKHYLRVDVEAGENVKYIFKTFLECGNKAEVARQLSEKGILTPEQYKKSKGSSYNSRYKETTKFWTSAQVGRIIRNRVYLGTVTTHTREVVCTGSLMSRRVPKEEWIVRENKHEPLISLEVFVNAQLVDVKPPAKKEKRRMGSKDSPIKGFVKCGGCHHVLNRRARLNATYECRHYYAHHNETCLSEQIKEEELLNIVTKVIRQQAKFIMDMSRIVREQEAAKKIINKELQQRETKLIQGINEIKLENMRLYESHKSGELDRSEFLLHKKKNGEKQNNLTTKLKQVKERKVEQQDTSFCIFDSYSDMQNITKVTREIVELLVSEICVYSKSRVEIKFNFVDEINALYNLNKNMV